MTPRTPRFAGCGPRLPAHGLRFAGLRPPVGFSHLLRFPCRGV